MICKLYYKVVIILHTCIRIKYKPVLLWKQDCAKNIIDKTQTMLILINPKLNEFKYV